MSNLNSDRDNLGRTPLLVAIIRKVKWEEIRDLLNPLSVHEADFKGNTCLHYGLRCLHYDDLDMIKEFLNHGADVNIQNVEGNTALHLAARHILFRFRIMKELLDYGGDPNITNVEGDTPLHIAVRENCTFRISANTDDIKDLLYRGANPNASNGQFLTPLHIAVSAGYCHDEVIEELLKYGARVSDQKIKIIHSAVRNHFCDHNIVRKLIYEDPLLLNCNETYKGTPLHLAVSLLRHSIIDEFLNCGAEVNTRDGHSNMPLHIAAQNPKCDLDIFTTLLNSGAIVNCQNYFKCTPLLEAARLSQPHALEILLAHGAEVNAVDVTGNSALHYAVDNVHMTLHGIKVLLEYGADPDVVNNEHVTPLYYCSQEAYAQILIQYTVLRKFHMGYNNNVIYPEKILDLSIYYTSQNYAKLLTFRDLCIEEVTRMKNDKIENNCSLYDFLLEKCSQKMLCYIDTDPSHIYEVLTRLNSNSYCYCKDTIFSAIKTEDLMNVLAELQIYTNYIPLGNAGKKKTVVLNSYIVEYLVQFLMKQDMLNLALVFLKKKLFY